LAARTVRDWGDYDLDATQGHSLDEMNRQLRAFLAEGRW